MFVSSDAAAASVSVAALVDGLGFAPIELGKIAEGGLGSPRGEYQWAEYW